MKGPELSPKLQEIKKRLEEGRYEVDQEALAGALLDAGALDDNEESRAAATTKAGDDMPQNDQKPKDD